MSCCDGIIKYLLFFFNLLFSLSGLALIITGSVLLYQSSEYNNILSEIKTGYLAPQIVLIVLGVVIFITASLGCCGAIQENRCKLITFAILLLSIFIIELAIGIYAAINMQDITDLVTKGMRQYFENMFNNPEQEKAFYKMQELLHCCGVSSYFDYITKGKVVPQSCCRDCGIIPKYYDVGCATAVTDFTTNAGKIIAALGIALALIEVVGAAFALRLASLIERRETVVY